PAGARPVDEGNRRPPRARLAGDDPHLCQGRSGRAARRRGLPPGGPAMTINELVTHYVTFRRTLGERCAVTEKTLRSFCRAVGPRPRVARIRLRAVAEFLAGTGPATRTWHFKHSALKGLFRFAVSRGHLANAPLPTDVPKRPPTLIPYIYSRAEIRRLLDAIPPSRHPCARVEAPT